MNLKHTLKYPAFAAILCAVLSAEGFSQSTNPVSTDPVGFVTTTIAAGTVSGPTPTFVSPVLSVAPSTSGLTSGTLSSVASNTLSVTSAGWTSGGLNTARSYLMLTSGAQSGLILRISSNTADTTTVETSGINLTSVGVASGDSFKLVEGETLQSMFGTPADGVLGGTAAAFASRLVDTVNMADSSGIIRTYYFNTDFNQWRRSGSSADQGSVPISPNSGALYFRKATTSMALMQTGTVPTKGVRYIVPAGGNVFLGRFFPAEGTISSLGIQNLPGWTATTDKVITVDSSGVLRTYFWDGAAWKRSGSSGDQGSVSIPAGSAVYTFRPALGSPQILSVALPYSL